MQHDAFLSTIIIHRPP